MYCIIKCIVQGKQARVKNADLRHPSLHSCNVKTKICVTRPHCVKNLRKYREPQGSLYFSHPNPVTFATRPIFTLCTSVTAWSRVPHENLTVCQLFLVSYRI